MIHKLEIPHEFRRRKLVLEQVDLFSQPAGTFPLSGSLITTKYYKLPDLLRDSPFLYVVNSAGYTHKKNPFHFEHFTNTKYIWMEGGEIFVVSPYYWMDFERTLGQLIWGGTIEKGTRMGDIITITSTLTEL